jgi:hypothetical protein
MMMKQSIIT